jgi:hypothetical protein
MPDKTNGPRPTSESRPQTTTKTTVKSTRSMPDFNRCDRSCGPCFITFLGDVRKCEADFLAQARRELAVMLAGGGDRG